VLVRHWVLSDPRLCRDLGRALGSRDLYIADGHHRHAAALSFYSSAAGRGLTPALLLSLVSAEEFQAFLFRWQHCHPDHRLVGPEGLLKAIESLQGEDFPVAFWEQELIPARLEAYEPAWLDHLGLTGQLVWFPFEPGHPGRLGMALRENLAWLRPRGVAEPELDEPWKAVLRHLQLRGASFVQELCRSTGLEAPEVLGTLWQLLWLGLVTTDTFQAIREGRSRKGSAHEARRRIPTLGLPERRPSRREARRRARERLTRLTDASGAGTRLPGRWSVLAADEALPPEKVEEEWARLLLERYGILSRELAQGRDWPALRRALTRLEYAGEVLRGYFVEGLSGEQYALAEAVNQLAAAPRREPVTRLSLCDPATLWGSIMPLCRPDGSRLTVSRIPQHVLLLRGGTPRLLAEGYGRDLTPLAGFDSQDLPALIAALQELLRRPPAQRPVRRIEVQRWDGRPIRESEAAEALRAAGFYSDGPRFLWDGYPGPGPVR